MATPTVGTAVSTDSASGAGSLVATLPTYAAGDYLLAWIYCWDNDGTAGAVTAPGWNVVTDLSAADYDDAIHGSPAYNRATLLGRVADGSEGTTVTFTEASPGTTYMTATITPISGADASPVDVVASAFHAGFDQAYIDAPDVTTTAADDLLLRFLLMADNATASAATSATEWSHDFGSISVRQYLFSADAPTPGAVGTERLSFAGGFNTVPSIVVTLAVKAAAGGGGSAYDAAVAADSPLLYWKVDETSGSSATDASGNGKTGTYTSATLAHSPIVGGVHAASFGSSGYLLSDAVMNGGLGTNGEMAVDGWLDYDGTFATSGHYIMVAGFLSGIGGAAFDKILSIDDAGHAVFYVYDGTPKQVVGSTVLSAGVHHLAGEYDHVAGELRVYVDGVLDGTTTGVTATYTGGSEYFTLAGLNADAVKWAQPPSAWVFDDWAVYGAKLGGTRVAAHYAAGLAVAGAPSVTSFTPTSGPWGTSVVVTGTGFTGATDVLFNGNSATSYTVDSSTQITAVVPVGATDGVITVTTPGGSDDSSTSFDVTPPFDGDTSTGGTGGVRVSIAFDDPTLEPHPAWTDVTALAPNLVAGYDLDRGRQFELDYTDTGDYTLKVYDRDGVLDPTNSSGPLYGKIEPDLQVKVELWNPVAREWRVRFRGWVEDFDYDMDPSQRVQTLTITCYDIFALLSLIEMQPGAFGDTVPAASAGNLFFDNATFQDRILQVLTNAGIGTAWHSVFTGNVQLLEGIYSPGDTPMNVIQDALDAEFPGVSNAYPDRLGRFAAHGRLAKFDPGSIAAAAGNAAWDYHVWKVGDAAAIAGDSTTVQLRPPYAWNRGRSKIINSALCYPKGIADASIPAQYVRDDTSIGLRGFASWSRENVLIDHGILTGNNGKDECRLFAQFYVSNYAEPRNRVSSLTVLSIHPDDPRASRVWSMLTRADIADKVELTVAHPGGGGFNLEPFFIEGIRESAEPLTGEYAMVTMHLDVSPAAYFTNPEGLDGS